MGDSAAIVWESELLRARQWLAATRKDEQHEQTRLFWRIKSHIAFTDHCRSLQSETIASEDEDDDTALDFLGDVDLSDMNALLQAEAAGANALVNSNVLSASDTRVPLEMPLDLASPEKIVKLMEMDPVNVTMDGTEASDASVQALIQTLDVTHVEPFNVEAGSTEESTLFHLLQKFGQNETKIEMTMSSDVKMEVELETEQAKLMHYELSTSPPALSKDKTDRRTTARPDVKETKVVDLDFCDLAVVRRKEKLRRKQRDVKTSEEVHRPNLRHGKTRLTLSSEEEGGSESGGSVNSAYSPSPVEDEDDSEPDEKQVADGLDDGREGRRSVKRVRKRLQQTKVVPKKTKLRLRKPIVTHKLAQQGDSTQDRGNVMGLRSLTECNLATGEILQSEGDSRTMPSQPPKHVVSKDKPGVNEKVSSPKEGEDRLLDDASATDTYDGTIVCVEMKESTLRSEVPDKTASLLGSFQEKDDHEEARVLESLSPKPATILDGDTVGKALAGVALEPLATGCTARGADDAQGSLVANVYDVANAADAHLPPTGTVDMEGKDVSLLDEVARGTVNVSTPVLVVSSDVGEEQESVTPKAVGDGLEWVDNDSIVGETQQRAEASDEDLSEAETEILEDDTPDTNDLGLDDSDDSDYDIDNFVNKTDRATGTQGNGSGNEQNRVTSNKKASDQTHDSTSSNQQALDGQRACASIDGVQQFFDFSPVKVTRAATTAFKAVPVYSHDVTHVQLECNEVDKPKKRFAVPTNPSIGSNGLRSYKTPCAVTTIRRGKYLQIRRCTKMLNGLPEGKHQLPSQYTVIPTSNSKVSSDQDLDDVPLAFLAKEMPKTSGDESQTRYLSYAGTKKKTSDSPSSAVQAPRIVSKSRYGGGLSSGATLAAQPSFSASIEKPTQVVDNSVSNGKYRQEPQISLYDALHIDGQDVTSDIREGSSFKRPNRFKKMQEEAVRKGVCLVKSRVRDADWDKLPIPKKRKKTQKVEEPTLDAEPRLSSKSDHGSKKGARHDDRRKECSASYSRNSRSNHYGPQGSQPAKSDKHDFSSRGRPGQERDNSKRDRKIRLPLSPSRDRGSSARNGRSRDDRRRKGSPRSRSRSPSPRKRENSSKQSRHRSRSRSRERSSKRDHRHLDQTTKTDRDRYRKANGRRRSTSQDSRDSRKTESLCKALQSEKVIQNSSVGGTDTPANKREIPDGVKAPPSPGALATFDSDDDVYITDSDDDGRALMKEVEDIRFDLESVSVDETLLMRQVYVSGLNPTVCAEQIEEDFARFGVGVDQDTGFPAIEVFVCQRNYLGRGDARVTFITEGGAKAAVEELNSKNVKNSMIQVRQMDVHTQRILMLQFEVARDTWKCTGTQCRTNVSVWNAKCDKCGRNRVYGPSNTKIRARSWLCSL
uniref:RRM domain-containing protein n=1 Tax=Hyaloperonospora arabidopsidis (strain Emoy2) TaxID=559515 RepID=M4BQW2_HYAAE